MCHHLVWDMQVNKYFPFMYPQERHPLKMKHIPAPPPPNFLLFCANEVRAGGGF